MKKSIMIGLGLALLSTSAYATKSRLSALGQNEARGSHYIDDTRSVFRNAAHVNTMNNYVVTEWGNNTGAAGTTENAEGGFFRSSGAFAYGLYYGSDLDDQNAIRSNAAASTNNYGGSSIAMGSSSLMARTNEIGLFFGGDMGVQWGAPLQYSKAKNEGSTLNDKEADQSGLALGGGIIMGDLELYANLKLSDDSENFANASTTGAKWEGGGVNIGASYGWGDWTFFAEYDKISAEFTAGSGVAKNETERTSLEIGAGNTHEVSSTARVYYNVSYKSVEGEDKDGTTAANNRKQKDTNLPFTVGFEADANSWLTVRGAISANVLISDTEVTTSGATGRTFKETDVDSQSVTAGATLNFGKLKIDGVIGSGESGNSSNDDLALDNLFTEVAVHYWF